MAIKPIPGFPSAGLPYAEISVRENLNADTVGTDPVQFTHFNTNGESNKLTPDHTNDHIFINIGGRYLIVVSVAAQSDDAQSIEMDISCWKNNGTEEITNVHAHRSFSGGVTDLGSISISGIHNFSAGDTLELWYSAQASRDIILSDVNLSACRLGN
jgi:hypothetical protein